MNLTPKLEYDSPPVTLEFRYPLPPFGRPDVGRGGSDVSAGGIPEAFKIMKDYIVSVVLYFMDSEYDEVESWFDWAQSSGQAFTFWFDKDDDTTDYSVYLHEPRLGTNFPATRDGTFAGLWRLEVQLRTAVPNTRFLVNWSGY